jgi:hypothetical protein
MRRSDEYYFGFWKGFSIGVVLVVGIVIIWSCRP